MPGADVIYILSSPETSLFCLVRTRRGLCRINLNRVPEFIFLLAEFDLSLLLPTISVSWRLSHKIGKNRVSSTQTFRIDLEIFDMATRIEFSIASMDRK